MVYMLARARRRLIN